MTTATTNAQLPDGLREAIAREICKQHGCPPDQLEPGDAYGVDGHLGNGDPAHFNWRRFTRNADKLMARIAPFFTPPAAPAVSDEARKAREEHLEFNEPDQLYKDMLWLITNEGSTHERTARSIADMAERHIRAATAEKQAECERLKSQLAEGREQWRMSSVCREQEAEIEKLRAELTQEKGRWELEANSANRFKDELTTLTAENDRLKQELQKASDRIDDITAREIHSCSDDCQRPLCVSNRRIRQLEQELAALAGDKAAWGTGIPEIPSGARDTFWCAFKRSDGNIGHRYLVYCNAYLMPLSDSCDEAPSSAIPVGDDGEYAWTGWHEEACDQCDTQWAFSGEVIAWLRVPKFAAMSEQGKEARS